MLLSLLARWWLTGKELPNLAARWWATKTILPIVIYHGMGDSCCSEPMEAFMAELRLGIGEPVFIHPIQIGGDPSEDRRRSLFDNVDRQIEEVCAQLKGIPELQGGFNAIGISQVKVPHFPF